VVKQPGHVLGHPPPTSAEVKERAELHLYSLYVTRGILLIILWEITYANICA
jgi:hypothetical protein